MVKAMVNLFGEDYTDAPKRGNPTDPKKRAWENAFQRWSNEISQDGSTPLGKCGFGTICDYCKDNDKGRPCVRALNAWSRDKGIEIDFSNKDFEKWF